MSEITTDIRFKDLFKGLNMENIRIPNDIKIPDEYYNYLLDYVLERSYLNTLSSREHFLSSSYSDKRITWLRILRLPIHPDNMENYDLLSRWQGVLSVLHTWGYRLIFLLQRVNGETNIYIGTSSPYQGISSVDAIEQIKEAASANMPGIGLDPIKDLTSITKIQKKLLSHSIVGAVTGIPSLRENSDNSILQTLDNLAFGIRDMEGMEKDYSMVIIADPVNDTTIADTISKIRTLSSNIHTKVSRNVSESESRSENKTEGAMVGTIIGLLTTALMEGVTNGTADSAGVMAGMNFGNSLAGSLGLMKQVSLNFTKNVTTEYLDKFAKYAEELTEKHIERLKKGRNLGFWNVGIYVLGNSKKDVTTVLGMLRSVYSGKDSYVEPIRVQILSDKSNALDIVKNNLDLIPLVFDKDTDLNKEWHIFGKMYQYISTPLNTEELSIATSLPRRDVPGLRFVKTAVRFANNPAEVKGDTITLGNIVDSGIVQNNKYKISIDALVRHSIVTGSTGSGKSTTCKTIISEVLKRNIPVLIIEPAKDDYVRWAIEMNKSLPEKDKFNIYMPGVESFEGNRVSRLCLNPFQPGAILGAPIDMVTRCEQLTAILNASLPVSDILPVLIDETIFSYLKKEIGNDFINGEVSQRKDYPKLEGLSSMAKEILRSRNYEEKVQENIGASLETRFNYLTRGNRGKILNVIRSTNFDDLFSKPTIINVSRIPNIKDKALIMSLLMLSLYEYRLSKYQYDLEYRKKAQENKLLHLTVIEEAHNLLMKPPSDNGNSGNPQQASADLFSNILSEIRGYGQGILIVDQIPTRLISDAIKNTNYKIVHRMTSPDDCQVMAAGLALRPDQKSIIPALEIGNAIICGDMDDAAAWVKVDKPLY